MGLKSLGQWIGLLDKANVDVDNQFVRDAIIRSAQQGLNYIKSLPSNRGGVKIKVLNRAWGAADVEGGLETALNEGVGHSGHTFGQSLKLCFELAKRTPNFDVIDARIWHEGAQWHEREIMIRYRSPRDSYPR
ncbi:MAG: hypothetical protein J0L77_05745 [Alphaproteobacteria bacterium]|nr:hypothetical protein [Alphaproteobacteria bacterium]